MKKLFISVSLLAAVFESFGQGYTSFENTISTRISTNGLNASGLISGPVGSWYFALLVAPSTQNTIDASLAGWTFAAYGTNTSSAGRMDGNNTVDNYLAHCVQIAGYPGTASADFAVVAWSANLGSDWSAIYAGRPTAVVSGVGSEGMATWVEGGGLSYGWYGISAVADNIPLAPFNGPYTEIFGQIPGFSLNMYVGIPEPSTMVLGILGAAIFVLRRRK
jgi:hypothetical protein